MDLLPNPLRRTKEEYMDYLKTYQAAHGIKAGGGGKKKKKGKKKKWRYQELNCSHSYITIKHKL